MLDQALEAGHHACVAALLKTGADVNGTNPARCPDHEKFVEILIQGGGNKETKNCQTVRSIMKAARWGCDKCIYSLI